MSNKRGFSVIEAVIMVGVLLLLAGVGYVGWNAFAKSEVATQQTSVSTGQSAEVITTKADLEAAEKALGELNFEDDAAIEAQSQASL